MLLCEAFLVVLDLGQIVSQVRCRRRRPLLTEVKEAEKREKKFSTYEREKDKKVSFLFK